MISRAAAEWKEVATRLHFEGHEIKSTEKDQHYQTVDACRTVLIDWVEGKGRKPTTWDTLIKALEEAELAELASDLRDVLGV